MKNKSSAILVALAVTTLQSYAQEEPLPYVTLVAGYNAGWQLDHYQIPAGYIAEVLAIKIVTGSEYPSDPADINTRSQIQISRNGADNNFQVTLTEETIPENLPTFLGPTDFKVIPEGGEGEFTFISLKITPLPTETMTPSNTVVIPDQSGGDFDVILESSIDLVNWTEALPGSYGSQTKKRFFRLRITKTN
jgi:hypothetical protein